MRYRLLRGAGLVVALSALGACGSLGDPTSRLTATPESGGDSSVSPKVEAPQIAVSALPDYQKGKEALERGHVGKAIEFFLKAHRKNPESLEGVNALAVAYDMVGRPDLADRFFNKALALAPKDPDVLNNIGYAHLKRGDEEAAQRFLSQAKALAKGNEVILANLALLEDKPEPASDLEDSSLPAQASIQAATPAAAQVAALPKPFVARTSGRSQLLVTRPTPETAPFEPNSAAASPAPESAPESASEPAPEPAPVLLAEPVRLTPPVPMQPETGSRHPLQTAKVAVPEVKPDTLSSLVGAPLTADLDDGRLSARPESTTAMDADQIVWADPVEVSPEMPAMPVVAVLVEPLELPAEPGKSRREPSIASVIGDSQECALSLNEAKVTLVNGNGREGMARRTRGWLKLEGLATARLLNADHYSYAKSTIHYRATARCTAERLAESFDSLPRLVRDDSLSEDLRVLLGADALVFDTRVAALHGK